MVLVIVAVSSWSRHHMLLRKSELLGLFGLIYKQFKNGLERKLKVNLSSLKENPERKQALNLCTCLEEKDADG